MQQIQGFFYILGLLLLSGILFLTFKNFPVTDYLAVYVAGYFLFTRFLINPGISRGYCKFHGDDSYPTIFHYVPFLQETIIFDSEKSWLLKGYWGFLIGAVLFLAIYYFMPVGFLTGMGLALYQVNNVVVTFEFIGIGFLIINRILAGYANYEAYQDLRMYDSLDYTTKPKTLSPIFQFVVILMIFIPIMRSVSNLSVLMLTSKYSKYNSADLQKHF